MRDLFCGLVMLTNIHAGNKLRLILMSHKARVQRTACLNFVLDTAKREASRKSRNVSSVARCLTCGWAQEEHHEADGPLDTPHTARRNRPGQLPTARLPEKPQTGPKGGEDDDADPDEAFWGERRGFKMKTLAEILIRSYSVAYRLLLSTRIVSVDTSELSKCIVEANPSLLSGQWFSERGFVCGEGAKKAAKPTTLGDGDGDGDGGVGDGDNGGGGSGGDEAKESASAASQEEMEDDEGPDQFAGLTAEERRMLLDPDNGKSILLLESGEAVTRARLLIEENHAVEKLAEGLDCISKMVHATYGAPCDLRLSPGKKNVECTCIVRTPDMEKYLLGTHSSWPDCACFGSIAATLCHSRASLDAAIDYLVSKKQTEYGATIWRAAELGDTARIRVLVMGGANVNAEDCLGKTPLQWASQAGQEAAAVMLLTSGASAVPLTSDHTTCALHQAASYGHSQLACLLLDYGCSWGNHHGVSYVDLPAGVNHATPLHLACHSGSLETVKILLKHGASLEKEDMNYETAGGIAKRERARSAMHNKAVGEDNAISDKMWNKIISALEEAGDKSREEREKEHQVMHPHIRGAVNPYSMNDF